MKDKTSSIFQNIVPFLIAGISIALFFGVLFVFAYVFVWGVIIGGVLWLAYAIKQYFFPPRTQIKPIKKYKGPRIIEHDEDNKS